MADNNITTWLKKIFSLQTISLLVALVAGYYTYKTYKDSQPAQISVELPVLNEEKDEFIENLDTKGVKRYFSLGFYNIPLVSLNDGRIAGPENMLLFPVIGNKSKKSLKDFTADVSVWFDDNMTSLFKESRDDENFLNTASYEIKSESERGVLLCYKKNVLAPNSYLPYPLKWLILYNADKKIKNNGGEICFTYYITYDGAEEPIEFQYKARLYYDEDYSSDEEIDSIFNKRFVSYAMYNFLQNDVYAQTSDRREFEDGEWMFICRNSIYRNLKHISQEEFKNLDDYSMKKLQED